MKRHTPLLPPAQQRRGVGAGKAESGGGGRDGTAAAVVTRVSRRGGATWVVPPELGDQNQGILARFPCRPATPATAAQGRVICVFAAALMFVAAIIVSSVLN